MVLRLRVQAPNNWDGAKCHGQVQRLPGDDDVYDPFFPDEDKNPEQAERDAVDFCNGTIDHAPCVLRDGCLIFALTNNERFGVYGGMTELGRKALRKKWPWKGGKLPRPEWRWMPDAEAKTLVSPDELREDDDEPDD
jgi:hypothetical protein